MKCLSIAAPGKAQIIELPQPQPGEGEVRIRVGWIGLCGTDLSTWRGVNPLVTYPRILGHEVSGTVEALGRDVDTVAIGDQVVVIPYNSCGVCSACRIGRTNCCRANQTMGVQRHGALGGAVVVPEAKLMRVASLALRDLALVEPISVGFHAAARGRIRAGEVVAVVGCGGVGMGVIAGAAARGARVVALDVDERKLGLALRLGAAEAIDVRSRGVEASLAALCGGEGPTVAIEAAGNPDAFRACVDATAFAGRVVYIGYPKAPVTYDTKQFVLKELEVLGSRGALREDFNAAAAWLSGDPSRAQALVSHVVDFHAAGDALAAWDAAPGAVSKILINCASAGGG